jgi:hypothetical protein
MEFAATIGGAVIGKVVTAKLPIKNNLIKNLVPVAVGAFLVTNKNKTISSLGTGMIAAGGTGLVSSLVPGISGLMVPVVNGIDPLALDGVGAEDEPLFLSGDDFPEADNDNRIAGDAEFIAGNDEFMA